ncbi:MAG TPA: transposase [Ktedonobacterales bacterium]|jgi:IS605 OrfB family transposase|nr:transposase [Ktedonobacterales bacterium]
MRLTRAVTNIRLCAANDAKVQALDAVAAEFKALCQQYVTHFCTEAEPDGYADPCFVSPLSQRWHRVAIQQAAGVARSWRTNYLRAQDDFADTMANWYEERCERRNAAEDMPPEWKPWKTPTLRKIVIRANANVAVLQPSENSTFAYWLRVSTLDKGRPLFLPVQVAAYHEQCLAGKMLDSSVTLIRKPDGWWLTVTYEDEVPLQTLPSAPVVGVDVGISHFLTTSTGKHYGSFQGSLAKRHQRDREKRRRKAKLRACLKKKGIERLPSVQNFKLARTVRQEINRAINQLYLEHPGSQIAFEQLNVAGMRFKTRRMNASLYASNLAHLPRQLAWGAAKRGIQATTVKSAYTSQECQRCHHVARSNRPTQQTFCCEVCGFRANADANAAVNIASRARDNEVQATTSRQDLKNLLDQRHQRWRLETGWP